MIYIKKGPEPEAFRQWKEPPPYATYGEIPREVGRALRNAHIVPQSKDTGKTLDYGNLCASCNTGRHTKDEKHCDEAQGNRELPVTPLQKDCISYFSFGSDGEILANLERTKEEQEWANATISILRLNTSSLIAARKKVLRTLKSLPPAQANLALERLFQRNS